MDTIVELQAQGTRSRANKAIKSAIEELKRVDSKLGYQKSLIMRLNTTARLEDQEIYALLKHSLFIHQSSLGAFSLTLRPILDAWGFSGSHSNRIPDKQEFANWKKLPKEAGIHLLEDSSTITLETGVSLDLGGIAKGYAVDKAVGALIDEGITTGLINAGGDIRAFGKRTWHIGIQNPRGQGIIATIPIRNKAIATSGDYERYFIDKGHKYCHILDPQTGWPARHYMSTSIIASSCIDADAWATAVFVKGIDELKDTLQKNCVEWIVIDLTGKVMSSDNLKKYCPEYISTQEN